MKTILVTGADGFLGRELCRAIGQRGHLVRRAVRRSPAVPEAASYVTGDLAGFREWESLVDEVDSIVHTAARAHVLAQGGATEVGAYRVVNLHSTLSLAEAAIKRGIRRFVFVSSIGVNGNKTERPFTEEDSPAPIDGYAISKWEAELALRQRLEDSDTELVIVRPPLIYGAGVKGNLLRLMRLVSRGWPLPLGSLRAPRSFIGRENLCDLLVAAVEHPAAAGQVFLAAEFERRSTAEMLEAIAGRMQLAGRIWRCPQSLLTLAAAVAGKRAELEKLSAALEVDPSKAMRMLQWTPRVPFQAGVDAMVDSYLETR